MDGKLNKCLAGWQPSETRRKRPVDPMDDSQSSRQAPVAGNEPGAPPELETPSSEPGAPARRPSYVFLGIVAAVVLLFDVGTKAWAELALSPAPGKAPRVIVLIDHTLSFALAYNEGGAWGLFQSADAAIRRPFFLIVSLLAIGFIVSLYRKLVPGQWALRWGLPLVLGGALGNLSDRVARTGVVDFILYRADWVGTMNEWIGYLVSGWTKTEYWPTFNVADIAICAGVGLMAVDMVTSRRSQPSPDQAGGAGGPRRDPTENPAADQADAPSSTEKPTSVMASADP